MHQPSAVLVLLILCAAAPMAQEQAFTVDDDQVADFQAIQPAVDAAAGGDLIYVRPGSYAGFTIDGVELTVLFAPGASVVSSPATVVVRNLASGEHVVLRGIAGPPLRFEDCEGSVTLEGADTSGQAIAEDCADLLVASSKLRGGLRVTRSDAHLWDSSVRVDFGPGGTDACVVTDGYIYLSGCQVQGEFGSFGQSGSFLFGFCTNGGPGGDGLVLVNSTGHRLASTIFGGPGGPGGVPKPSFPPCSNGPPGSAVVGTGLTTLPGTAHVFSSTAPLLEHGVLGLHLDGEPGEHVFALIAATPAPISFLIWSGTWVAPLGWVLFPLGVLPGSGVLDLSIPFGVMGNPAVEGRTLLAQALFVNGSTLGPDFLGSPTAILILDEAVPIVDCNQNGVADALDLQLGTSPDCDGNGVPDECDVAAGADCNGNGVPDACDLAALTSPDCDGNGAPDECDVATGAAPDCNLNGVPDACDIASGASPDLDGDGVPDACESVLVVPTQYATLAAAVTAASDGDMIVVRDGVHTGPGFVDVSLLGKNLEIRSLSGPAGCTIDAAGAGRILRLDSGEPPTTRIRGITLRGGIASLGGAVLIDESSAVFENCVFEGNFGPSGGGAMRAVAVDPEARSLALRGCVFRGNSGGSSSEGGALFTFGGLNPPKLSVTIDACVFEDNTAGFFGGAIDATGGVYAIRDSLFARNRGSSGLGGALNLQNGVSAFVSGCTFSENEAPYAGAIAVYGSTGFPLSTALVENCVLWNDGGPALIQGPEFYAGQQSDLTVRWSIATGGQAAVYEETTTSTVNWGPGNLDVDPQFVSPPSGDFHLAPGSPAIDAGDPAFVPFPGETDFEGDPRVNGPRVDMGADEVHP